MARTDFLLGDLNKQTVREIARRARLPVAEKPESQEICFVPSGDYADFIAAYRNEQGIHGTASADPSAPTREDPAHEADGEAGELVTTSGELLGRHHGVHHFTIGQRKGLGVSADARSTWCKLNPPRSA